MVYSSVEYHTVVKMNELQIQGTMWLYLKSFVIMQQLITAYL